MRKQRPRAKSQLVCGSLLQGQCSQTLLHCLPEVNNRNMFGRNPGLNRFLQFFLDKVKGAQTVEKRL